MATKIVNTTYGQQAVYRGDGLRVYGLDAELELKRQAQRDVGYEKELGKWIESATGMKLEFPDDLIESLRSGIILCNLINALLPGTISKINQKPLPLMQIENIGLYLKACWKVGIPSSDLFVTSDLYQRKSIPAVLQNIASVARSSHTCPEYKGPTFGIKPPQAPPAKKWEEIKYQGPVFVTDLEQNQQHTTVVSSNCKTCGKEKSCGSCESVKTQQDLKERDSKLLDLSNRVQDQSQKISILTKDLESQRTKFEQNERQMKQTIESQLDHIQQKEKEIQKLSAMAVGTSSSSSSSGSSTYSSNNRIPSTTFGSPPVSTNTNRNTTAFGSPPLSSTPPSTTTPTVSIPAIKENRFSVKVEQIACWKCNFQNSKVSKYCISCGSDIKKESSTFTNSNNTTSGGNNANLSINNNKHKSTSFVNNQPIPQPTIITTTTTTTITPPSVDRKETDQLNEKIEQLCKTIKDQEDQISQLKKQIKSENEQFEKKLREQKQIVDNQLVLLNQKEKDIKEYQDSSLSRFGNSTKPTMIIKSTSPPQPSFINNQITLPGTNSNQPNKISFSVTGFRSKVVGPGTYKTPTTSTSPTGTTTTSIPIQNSNNNNEVTTKAEMERIEYLESLVKQLEVKLNEEVKNSKVKDSTIKILEDKISVLQSRPTRKQALANSQVVVGKKRFSTLKPDNLDNRLVETTLSHINDILFSRPIEFHQVSQLNALFKTEQGRRRFSQILQMTLKQVPTLALSESSFEFMLYLLNTILQEMDYSKEQQDFITAKVIFNSSDSLYRINSKTHENEYLKSFIKSGLVWKKMEFWEDMFWRILSKRHRKLLNNNMETIDKDIVRNLLTYFGVNMIQFNLPMDQVSRFVSELSSLNQLSESDVQQTLSMIKTQIEIQERVSQQKINLYQQQQQQQTQQLKPDLSTKSTSNKSKKDKDKKK
ncbi:hypothetical protein DLAC_06904 [Tieghemostelium lacteum]|uniref:Calponin-homology (CH) domain-containing protein n=1 Tax=Tieghemostelium lacteum TaxID=361077 RepID=A0A151ZDN4_TIELA|nr:hypothetical protein DLAC_06904 [Tieghemostelium lacteum]|eukprot:KYQ92066.1 hypothetical protein DLAC_06904 [Tieghemostelium lacteum]